MKNIPFVVPYIDEKDRAGVIEALMDNSLGGNGPMAGQVEALLSDICGVKHALLMTSCSHSLEASVRSLGIGKGDEVILPSFSFPSAANAVLMTGANVVLADIELDTLNIEPTSVAEKINKKTRSILPVHYAGISCDMDQILQLAQEHKLWVIEDAAQCIGAEYKSRPLGSIGDIGCLSFHATKNVVSGEGGAFLTNDGSIASKADIIREKGTNRSRFLRGEIDKYFWVDIGSSYVLSDILASLLFAQLGKLETITEKRAYVHKRYVEGLNDIEQAGKIKIGKIPAWSKPNYHIFYMLVESRTGESLLNDLHKSGIAATSHFYPLHLSQMGQKLGYVEGDLPNTETAFRKLIRLPIYPGLQDLQIDYIVEKIRKYTN